MLNVVAEDARVLAAKFDRIGSVIWLSEGYAFDIFFDGNPNTVLAEARGVAKGMAADVNAVAAARRRKKLLVADMESTVVSCECLDELAEIAGVRERVAAITERAMGGEIEFPEALRSRVALLRGLPLSALERVWRERVRLDPGAGTLVATMHAHGARTVLVSGGFTWFARRVAEETGFDAHRANVLLHDGARLLGTLAEPILDCEAKLQALEDSAAAMAIDAIDTLAVGDGANDLAMIARAGLGVAYHAKPVLERAAPAIIAHGDLAALLYLQGYRESEFVRRPALDAFRR